MKEKEFVLKGEREIQFREYEERTLKEKEARLKTILSGISHGTEINSYRATAPFRTKGFDKNYRIFIEEKGGEMFGGNLGYENAGEVIEVGKGVNKLEIGMKVHALLPHRPTNIIDEEADNYSILPLEISAEAAVFISLSRVAITAIHDAKIVLGENVAVFGMGCIGLLVIQMAKLSGASKVFAIDPIEKRLSMARELGADFCLNPQHLDVSLEIRKILGKGVDCAVESSGNYKALHEAIRSVNMGARVITLGYYQGGGSQVYLGEEWHHNRITLISSMLAWDCPHRDYPLWNNKRVMETVLDLLKNRKLKVEEMITHKFHYKDAQKAYELIDKKPEKVIKVVFSY